MTQDIFGMRGGSGQVGWRAENFIQGRTTPSSTFFDLVYSFSALQYMRDPLALMAQLGSYTARAVLIAGVPFGEQAFVRKETTRGLDTPSRVVSLSETAKQMEKSGYRLALTQPGEDCWKVDDYSGDQKVGRMSAMLFLKIRNRRDRWNLLSAIFTNLTIVGASDRACRESAGFSCPIAFSPLYCEFRFISAGFSDVKPATVPI